MRAKKNELISQAWEELRDPKSSDAKVYRAIIEIGMKQVLTESTVEDLDFILNRAKENESYVEGIKVTLRKGCEKPDPKHHHNVFLGADDSHEKDFSIFYQIGAERLGVIFKLLSGEFIFLICSENEQLDKMFLSCSSEVVELIEKHLPIAKWNLNLSDVFKSLLKVATNNSHAEIKEKNRKIIFLAKHFYNKPEKMKGMVLQAAQVRDMSSLGYLLAFGGDLDMIELMTTRVDQEQSWYRLLEKMAYTMANKSLPAKKTKSNEFYIMRFCNEQLKRLAKQIEIARIEILKDMYSKKYSKWMGDKYLPALFKGISHCRSHRTFEENKEALSVEKFCAVLDTNFEGVEDWCSVYHLKVILFHIEKAGGIPGWKDGVCKIRGFIIEAIKNETAAFEDKQSKLFAEVANQFGPLLRHRTVEMRILKLIDWAQKEKILVSTSWRIRFTESLEKDIKSVYLKNQRAALKLPEPLRPYSPQLFLCDAVVNPKESGVDPASSRRSHKKI